MQTTAREIRHDVSPAGALATGMREVVIKLGGSVHDPGSSAWAQDLAHLVGMGLRPVVVHGGGPELTHWMGRLGLETRFVAGHRVTCRDTAVLAEMVFAGRVNKQIVSLLNRSGVAAVGVSGNDGGLLRVRRHRPGGQDAGYVGEVEVVDPRLLRTLLHDGYVPVVAPTASDLEAQPYNINADVVAAAVAGALRATELLFLCDVPGFLQSGRCVPFLDAPTMRDLLARDGVAGGMRPKLEAALAALQAGVERVRLVDGRLPHVLVQAFSKDATLGTCCVADGPSEAKAAAVPAWSGTLASRGAQVLMQTYAREPLEIVAAQGSRVTDSQGRSYLDFGSGIAVTALGHGHPSLVRGLRNAAAGLVHTSNLYWTEPMVRLAERLVAATGMERAFFCNSGAEAIEAGLKWARKAHPQRRKVVIFAGSFHGRTLGALSATAREAYQTPFRPLLDGFLEVPFGDFAAAEAAIDAETALVLVEPIQGEGGVRPTPPGFLAHLRQLCDRQGAFLLFDEVQTGMGRTGTFLASQDEAVLPDALTLAKALAGGLPVGVLLARGEAAQAFVPGDHGSTFGGGPLVANAAHAVLDQVLQPSFLAQVQRRGESLHGALQQIARDWPEEVSAVRGRGLMAGVVLTRPWAQEWTGALREAGMLALQAGKDVLRLLPPLVVGEAEIDEAVSLLRQTLARQARRGPS